MLKALKFLVEAALVALFIFVAPWALSVWLGALAQ
jgi:cell division protein FtsX